MPRTRSRSSWSRSRLANGLALALVAGCGRIGFDPADPGVVPNDAPVADGSPASCANDPRYVTVPGLTSRYRMGMIELSWMAAQADCQRDGAHLTVLDDVVEANEETIGDWIGVTDAGAEGVWLTVAGEPAPYLSWIAGEPDGGTAENCARLEDGQLEDRQCVDARDYSCECP